MRLDPEGRVRVFTRARWPVMVAAWLIAVVLITLLTSRAIHVVGHQLSSTVALPQPHAAREPVVVTTPQTVPTAPATHHRQRPPSSTTTTTTTVTQSTSTGGSAGAVVGSATTKSRPP